MSQSRTQPDTKFSAKGDLFPWRLKWSGVEKAVNSRILSSSGSSSSMHMQASKQASKRTIVSVGRSWFLRGKWWSLSYRKLVNADWTY